MSVQPHIQECEMCCPLVRDGVRDVFYSDYEAGSVAVTTCISWSQQYWDVLSDAAMFILLPRRGSWNRSGRPIFCVSSQVSLPRGALSHIPVHPSAAGNCREEVPGTSKSLRLCDPKMLLWEHPASHGAPSCRWDASILRRCVCHVLSESRRQRVNVTLHEHKSCLWDVGTNCGCLMRWGWPGSVCLCYKHWCRVSEWSLGRNLQREAGAKSQQRGCRKHSVDLTGHIRDEQPNAQASSLPSQPSLQASSAHSCPFPPSKSFLTFPSSFSWPSFHFADSSVTSKPQA